MSVSDGATQMQGVTHLSLDSLLRQIRQKEVDGTTQHRPQPPAVPPAPSSCVNSFQTRLDLLEQSDRRRHKFPESRIPKDLHILEETPVASSACKAGSGALAVEKRDGSYIWTHTKYPTAHPTTRQELRYFAGTLDTMFSRIGMELPLRDGHGDTPYDVVFDVFDVALHELHRHVLSLCSSRAYILDELRQGVKTVVGSLLEELQGLRGRVVSDAAGGTSSAQLSPAAVSEASRRSVDVRPSTPTSCGSRCGSARSRPLTSPRREVVVEFVEREPSRESTRINAGVFSVLQQEEEQVVDEDDVDCGKTVVDPAFATVHDPFEKGCRWREQMTPHTLAPPSELMAWCSKPAVFEKELAAKVARLLSHAKMTAEFDSGTAESIATRARTIRDRPNEVPHQDPPPLPADADLAATPVERPPGSVYGKLAGVLPIPVRPACDACGRVLEQLVGT